MQARGLKFSVAPMMEYTNSHQRYLQRLLSRHTTLYTEMITANAIIHSKSLESHMYANFKAEEPLVLQLGGSDPAQMMKAVEIVNDFGYKSYNINCGCPSARVAGAGSFGASLMLNPDLVADLALAISSASGCKPSVKCRLGVDDVDSYESLVAFVSTVSEKANVQHFVVHARKAILAKGFSAADNRKIPPLKYNFVYNLIRDFPNLDFTINGGISSLEECKQHFVATGDHLAGVMVGRAVVDNPFHWARVDSQVYGAVDQDLSRMEVLQQYAAEARRSECSRGACVRRGAIKPLWQLFRGEPNTKQFKILLETKVKDGTLPIDRVILDSLLGIDPHVLNKRPSDYATNPPYGRNLEN